MSSFPESGLHFAGERYILFLLSWMCNKHTHVRVSFHRASYIAVTF